MENYLFVTGGVVSSLGKGVTTASLAALFKACNLKVGIIKVDGYLNIDAGLMSPIEHGEVFVTHDGFETDLDIGNYERFVGIPISGKNSITAGRVFMDVISLERKGHYLGATVQIVPHLTNHIKSLIQEIGQGNDVTLVEIGGVVGDIESMHFLEAIRQMHLTLKGKCAFLHLGLVPFLEHTNENKTKPIQHSVRTLLSMGIQPDFIICRSRRQLTAAEIAKIGLFCNVDSKSVISSPDIASKYELPLRLAEAGVDTLILQRLGVESQRDAQQMQSWERLGQQLAAQTNLPHLRIGFVRKYLTNADNYVSLIDSLILSSFQNGCHPEVIYIDVDSPDIEKQLESADCVVVPGGWGESGVESMIKAIKFTREHNLPFLGICYGFQLALIEFARNVLGLTDAHTEEVRPETEHPIVLQLSKLFQQEHPVEQLMSPLLRLGTFTMRQSGETVFRKIYPADEVHERFRHRYTFNNKYHDQFEQAGITFPLMGDYSHTTLYDAFQYTKNDLHIGVQYHPELRSSIFDINPVLRHLVEFVAARVKGRAGGAEA